MHSTDQDQSDRKQDWQKTDARVLGQILAAQNVLFALPDTARIAEFFAQALVSIPGVTACRVCLEGMSVQVGLDSDACRECEALRKEAGEPNLMPVGFKCRLAEERDIRIITLEIYEHTFGFFVFRTDTTGVFESYRPFINNLANYIALSLESRLQKNLLQKSEKNFRDIFAKSPIGIEAYDSSGALLDANKACLDIFGISDIEEVKGFKLFEDPNITDEIKKKLLAGETVRYEAPFDFERVKEYHLYKTTKSDVIQLDVLVTPLGLKEEVGVGPTGYLVQVQDITARKLSEDELKKYKEHLEETIKERTAELTSTNRQLYQEIGERKRAEEILVQQSRTLDSFFKYTITPLVILDKHFNFIRVNEAYAAACQRDVSEFTGHNHFEFYPSDARIIFEQVVETKEPYQTFARPFSFPDHPEWGITYWDWILTPILSDKGEVEFLVYTLKDVTDQKRAEEALREREEKFRALFESATDGIFLLSPNGAVVELNTSFARMHGWTVEEMLNMKLQDLDAPESAALAPARLQRLFAGEAMTFEVEHYCKNGQTIPLEVSANRVIIGDEKYVLAFHRDITERKQLQHQLAESQKMESIGRLAGGIAHDFNNFLTAILGYIDLAEVRLPPGSPAAEDLAEAKSASGHAANLTRQLLLFGRREPVEMKPVQLSHAVGEMLKILGCLIGEQYRIKTELCDDPWIINADAGHLEQVLMNLVVNARDAMPEGGTIVLRTRNVIVDPEVVKTKTGKAKNRFVELSVSDSGFGMDEQTRSHIFEPFFTTKEKGKGTGLGLSVAYGIVTQHGGWIDVKSAPGKGSTFTIYFPATDAVPHEPGFEKHKREDLQGKGERVLLVEDEESIRKLAARMLSSNGYQVETAANAETAMDIYKREEGGFSLVFSDVILPGMDGINLCESLVQGNPDLRVLLASGYSDEISMKTIRQRGYRFIHKPYDLRELLRVIREELEKQR